MPQAAPVYYGAGGCTYYAQVAPAYHATGDAYLLMYGTGRILLRCKRAQPGWLQARAVHMIVRGPGASFGTPEAPPWPCPPAWLRAINPSPFAGTRLLEGHLFPHLLLGRDTAVRACLDHTALGP